MNLDIAMAHHQCGRLAEAEAGYREVLEAEPSDPDALHLLGLLYHHQGNNESAIELINEAIRAKPASASYHNSLGSVYQAQGRLDEAIASYRQALVFKPNFPGASYNLAYALQVQGRLDEAIESYRQAVLNKPDYVEAFSNLGDALRLQGRLDEAAQSLQQALLIKPDYAEAHSNLGNVLKDQERLDDAILNYQQALFIKPDLAEAHSNLGNALNDQGLLDDAVSSYRQAIALKPDYVEALSNLGNALQAQGLLEEAAQSYRQALSIKPDYAEALGNIGGLLALAQRHDEALAAYRDAIGFQPENPKIQTNLGAHLLTLGRADEAVVCFREALRLDPAGAQNHGNLILTMSYVSADPGVMLAECAQWELLHGAPLRGAILPHTNLPDSERRLRIAYVSADFRNHAVAYWAEPLLAAHQHDDHEIFCYSNSDKSDEVTDRLKRHADVWVTCPTLSDAALADRIRQDKIDILVDLSGHTRGNRLLVFARQPAPVQLSWFGFPVSSGLKAMNYRFTDELMDPAGSSEPFYAETLVRLPRFYAAFRPDPQTPEPGAGPAAKNGYVTFASFNNFTKITQPMLVVWAEILRATPESRLLFQATGLDGASLGGQVRTFFAENGVAPERLILRGWSGLKDYLALGQEADIALDPYPFNGGVTTCHALWMGLPVVSLSGQSAASRVGRSLLTHAGLPELVADNPAQYCAIAVGLAQDRARLAALRASMRGRMASGGLLDGPGLARDVEAAYRTMWRAWCGGPGLPG